MDMINKTITIMKEFQPPEGYYGAFSGGKDSQVLYHIAKIAGIKVDWHFNVTTVDPPQLLRFIRKNYSDVEWHRPSRSMFQLIIDNKILPTRIMRFCCVELKEQGGSGRVVITGVRADESLKRSRYNVVQVCKKRHKILVSPLLDWKWRDVWKFLNDRFIPHCELYDPPFGFKRIGCIGCPMTGRNNVLKEFRFFPNVKKAYLNAIQKAMANGAFRDHKTPESVFKWWISRESLKSYKERDKQLEFFSFD